MVDNQHKKIIGYRDLSEEEISLMNKAKLMAEDVGLLIQKFENEPTTDKRWVAIAKTDLQKGFMALIRGVAKPTTF